MVDDQSSNLMVLEAVLEDLGHTLVRASSGEEALKRLLHEEFALILMDVYMPTMDGFETAELIRRRERSRSTPIIFMTAIGHDRQRCLARLCGGRSRLLIQANRSRDSQSEGGCVRRSVLGRRRLSQRRQSSFAKWNGCVTKGNSRKRSGNWKRRSCNKRYVPPGRSSSSSFPATRSVLSRI